MYPISENDDSNRALMGANNAAVKLFQLLNPRKHHSSVRYGSYLRMTQGLLVMKRGGVVEFVDAKKYVYVQLMAH